MAIWYTVYTVDGQAWPVEFVSATGDRTKDMPRIATEGAWVADGSGFIPAHAIMRVEDPSFWENEDAVEDIDDGE